MNILFEAPSTPRIGVGKTSDKVVMVRDYSSAAFMMEEYIAFGVTKLIVPKSRLPDHLITDLNDLMVRNIKILDDSQDILNAGRLLYGVRKELEIDYNEDTGKFSYKKGTPINVMNNVANGHDIIRSISFGFNNKTQIDLDIFKSKEIIRDIRTLTTDAKQRTILSTLEGVLNSYDEIVIPGVRPTSKLPKDILNRFDSIISDASYGDYSNAIGHLNPRDHSRRMISDIRQYGRKLSESKTAELLWLPFQFLAHRFTGVELPNFGGLLKYVVSKEFPSLINLSEAKQRAIQSWIQQCPNVITSTKHNTDFLGEDVDWLPPAATFKAGNIGDRGAVLGVTSEVLQILEGYVEKKKSKDAT